MSVVTHNEEDLHNSIRKKSECAACGSAVYRYPFLQWNKILICGPCCRSIKRGFTADLVHTAAIVELRGLGYLGETLVRVQSAAEQSAPAGRRGSRP